jgi:colanic acid/amylovoran biosynthesis glycosyltransferase
MAKPVLTVGFLVNSFPELSEKFLVNQITGLMDAGHTLHIFSPYPSRAQTFHSQVTTYSLLDRTSFAALPRNPWLRVLRGVFFFWSLLLTHPVLTLRALNYRRYTTAVTNGKTLYYLRLFLRLRSSLSFPLDILHCHFGPNGLVGLFLRDCGFAQKLVVTYHGSDINTYPRRYGQGVYSQLYESADLFTANTSFTKNKLVENSCPPEKVVVLPVGLRLAEYPYKSWDLRDRSLILTVARLSAKKGHRIALQSLVFLKEWGFGGTWVFAGGGELRKELEAYAVELGVHDQVVFRGALGDGDIASLYAQAGVFVLPSVTALSGDMEGQGLVLQEAQACGIPVVSTFHNGIPDGVLNQQSGFLVPESDPLALAKALWPLVSLEVDGKKLGQAGRNFVQDRYDIPILTQHLIDHYKKLFL